MHEILGDYIYININYTLLKINLYEVNQKSTRTPKILTTKVQQSSCVALTI